MTRRKPDDSVTEAIRSTFANMVKVPRTLLTTHREHPVQSSALGGETVVYAKRGTGKAAVIVGVHGPFEIVVYSLNM